MPSSDRVPIGSCHPAWLTTVIGRAPVELGSHASMRAIPSAESVEAQRIPIQLLVQAWRDVAVLTDNDCFGLDLALEAPVGSYSIIEHINDVSMTALASLEGCVAAYARMSDLTRVSLASDSSTIAVIQRVPVGVTGLRHAWEAFLARTLLGVRRVGSPNLRPIRATFVHAQPSPRARSALGDLFGVWPEFGTATNSLVFTRRDIETFENPRASPSVYRFLCEYALRTRAQVNGGSWSILLEDVLDDALHFTTDDAAKALGTSGRTLQRRLAEEGTSFESVASRLRRTRAEHMLTMTRATVGDIAASLGFANSSSFTRAFTSWMGTSPAAFRAHAKYLSAPSPKEP